MLPFLFPNGSRPSLATPQSATPTAPLEGTPRGGGTMLLSQLQTFAAERCPLLGEVPSAHTGERGCRWAESAIRQKKERGNDHVTAQKPPIRVNFRDSTDSAPYKKLQSLSGIRRDCVRFMFACGCTVGSYIFPLRLQAAGASTVGAVRRRRSADGRRGCGGT